MPAPAPFTLAVDASWLRDGGIGRMAREILSRAPSGVRVHEIRADSANAGVFTPLDLAWQSRAVAADAIWSPGFVPPMVARQGVPTFITIHDLAHLHCYSWRHRLYYDAVIRPLLRNVAAVLTVSDYTRGEILDWTQMDPAKVICIHNGVSDAFAARSALDSAGERYLLYVGNRRPYKNVDRLIDAFAASGIAELGYQLWLTGEHDPSLSRRAASAGVDKYLRYLGHLDDEGLASAYRGARALAFVSLHEGFGLPVVEAMASGCPVLTSNTTALREVAGAAALQVDPTSVDAIATGLRRIVLEEPLRETLRAAGLVRAAELSWDKTAAAYWRVFTGG